METRLAFVTGPATAGLHPIRFGAIGGDAVEGNAASHTPGTETGTARNRGDLAPAVGAKVLVHRCPGGEWRFHRG